MVWIVGECISVEVLLSIKAEENLDVLVPKFLAEMHSFVVALG
jgi:hypothetical protein